jgi:hypothetical protein
VNEIRADAVTIEEAARASGIIEMHLATKCNTTLRINDLEVPAMDGRGIPVACTLTSDELRQREEETLHAVGRAVLETRELEDGYAFRFPPDDVWLDQLVNLVRLERECCPFLKFSITAEPGSGPIWLQLTGPDGTKEFLAGFFGEVDSRR